MVSSVQKKTYHLDPSGYDIHSSPNPNGFISAKNIPSGYDIHRASHGFLMAPIEIDGLPNLIAWWIFPWRTVK